MEGGDGKVRRLRPIHWVLVAVSISIPILLVGGVLAVRAFVVDHYVLRAGSMLPTFAIGDSLVAEKKELTTEELSRGDILLFEVADGTVLVKRLVGLPGDVVEVRDGHVRIAGVSDAIEAFGWQAARERLGERSWKVRLTAGGLPDAGPIKLGPSEYFVLGDNRGESRDSRSYGPVASENLVGRVTGVAYRRGESGWWPVEEIDEEKHPAEELTREEPAPEPGQPTRKIVPPPR